MKKNSLFLLLGMIFMGGGVCYAAPLPAGSYQSTCSNCTYDDRTLRCLCQLWPPYNSRSSTSSVRVAPNYKGKIENIDGQLTLTN